MSETMDFDRMFSEEVEKKSHTFKYQGKSWSIPPTVPMGLVLRYHRLSQLGDDTEVPDSVTFDMLMDVFGEDTVNLWAKDPSFDIERAMKILKWAMGVYNLTAKEETNNPKPKRGKGQLQLVSNQS